jgi:hypothetical protein
MIRIRSTLKQSLTHQHHPRFRTLDAVSYLDNFSLALEHGTRQRRLSAIIQTIGVSSMLNQELDQWRMAMVGCEHNLYL